MQGTEFLHLALDSLAADAGCDIPAWCRRQRRGSRPGGRGLCCIGHSRPRSDQSCSDARFDETVGPRGAGGHRCGFGATRQQHDKMEEDNRTEMAHGHSPAHKLRTRPPSMHGATSRAGRTTTHGLSRRDGFSRLQILGQTRPVCPLQPTRWAPLPRRLGNLSRSHVASAVLAAEHDGCRGDRRAPRAVAADPGLAARPPALCLRDDAGCASS